MSMTLFIDINDVVYVYDFAYEYDDGFVWCRKKCLASRMKTFTEPMI